MTEIFNCLTCGICCVDALSTDTIIDKFIKPENDYYIVLAPGEETKIPKSSLIEVTRGNRTYWATNTKRNEQGFRVCSFLEGEIGKSVRCSIHSIKPKICKDFKIGSLTCKHYRKKL